MHVHGNILNAMDAGNMALDVFDNGTAGFLGGNSTHADNVAGIVHDDPQRVNQNIEDLCGADIVIVHIQADKLLGHPGTRNHIYIGKIHHIINKMDRRIGSRKQDPIAFRSLSPVQKPVMLPGLDDHKRMGRKCAEFLIDTYTDVSTHKIDQFKMVFVKMLLGVEVRAVFSVGMFKKKTILFMPERHHTTRFLSMNISCKNSICNIRKQYLQYDIVQYLL